MTEPTSDFCAAYGCPLFGTFGIGGKWYCCCHFRSDHSRNDAITAEIDRHDGLVREYLRTRSTGAGYKAIKEVEDQLIALTADIGKQVNARAAGVIGPGYAEPHYTEEA